MKYICWFIIVNFISLSSFSRINKAYKTNDSKLKFENKPEFFNTALTKGKYPFVIRYYYKHIQNQLSILYRTEDDEVYRHFEELILPLAKF